MKQVKVAFSNNFNNKLYSYACNDPNVMEGDIAIILSPDGNWSAAQVVEVSDKISDIASKSVALIVPAFKLEEGYKEGQEILNEYREAKKRLKEMLAEFQELQVFEMLASHNPEARALLTKVKNFG